MSKSAHILSYKNATMKQLIYKAHTLSSLNLQVLPCLPQPLRDHCKVANYRPPSLVIEIDDAAWITPFRFYAPELIKSLHSQGLAQISKIDYILQKPS